MELLDRYLYAIKRYLPQAQQSDIVAELSDEIQSAMEEKEAALGRPLTLDEQSAILVNYGPPQIAAARYLKHQYLIGPAIFPVYVSTLKLVLSIAIGLEIVAAAFLAIAAGRIGPYFIAWGTLWSSIFWIIGVVTLIFAIRERVEAARPVRWDPRKLPVPQGAAPISRFSTGVDMFFNALFLSWVMDLPGVRSTFWHFASGGTPAALAPFALAPIWHAVLNAYVAIAVARILQGCINLIRPDWTVCARARCFSRILLRCRLGPRAKSARVRFCQWPHAGSGTLCRGRTGAQRDRFLGLRDRRGGCRRLRGLPAAGAIASRAARLADRPAAGVLVARRILNSAPCRAFEQEMFFANVARERCGALELRPRFGQSR